MYRPSWPRWRYPISQHLRPHTPPGRPHSTAHRVGASSLATFKYSAIPNGRYDPCDDPKVLPDHDTKSIQDTIEGLRLMSLLKCVHFSLTDLLPKLNAGVPRRLPLLPSFPPPLVPNPGPNLDPMASRSSPRSTRGTSRCASSRTVVSPPARPTSSKIRPKIRAPIMSSSVPVSFDKCLPPADRSGAAVAPKDLSMSAIRYLV